ncbi:MAG: SDR family oxidoreductase [Aureispira sp.]
MNAIVTGATKGIGRAIVELFAQKGYNVAFCARTAADVAAFQQELQANYQGEFLGKAVDMSDKKAVKGFATFVKESWSSVEVLVNNAGVFIPCPLTKDDTEDAFEKMMDLNLYSAYYLTQGILPLMLAQQKGHVFNMCSIASIMPYGAYAVSKHALLGFSRVLREEVKDKGVRVTAVMPGATYTASWDGTDLPQERFMKAEDIAQSLWDIYQLSQQTVVEEIVLRPQLGDI